MISAIESTNIPRWNANSGTTVECIFVTRVYSGRNVGRLFGSDGAQKANGGKCFLREQKKQQKKQKPEPQQQKKREESSHQVYPEPKIPREMDPENFAVYFAFVRSLAVQESVRNKMASITVLLFFFDIKGISAILDGPHLSMGGSRSRDAIL